MAKLVSENQMILFPVTNSGYGIGQKGSYCDESTPLNPISHYGKTKVAAEKVLRAKRIEEVSVFIDSRETSMA